MARITVIGAGYVGLVTAACLAQLGNRVVCVDIDEARVKAIREGRLPIREPGLDSLWSMLSARGRLRITHDYSLGLRQCDFVFFCVGTPPGRNGNVRLMHLMGAVRSVMEGLAEESRPTLIIKSTVPVGTANFVRSVARHYRGGASCPPVVSNPEFLREGHAVDDFMRPDRIIIGHQEDEEWAAASVSAMYEPLRAPILICDQRTAELTKYISNAYLAFKVSFINELAELCEEFGVDVQQVASILGMDQNIGGSYLQPGLGWGGSCLPKDLSALRAMAAGHAIPDSLLAAVHRVNERQPKRVIRKLRAHLGDITGRRIGVWGLAFKPECDDSRKSPSVALVKLLRRSGCSVSAWDPAVSIDLQGVQEAKDPYEAARHADAVVAGTAWPQMNELDFGRVRSAMRGDVVIDARNCLPAESVTRAGLKYEGMGRPEMIRTPQASNTDVDTARNRARKTYKISVVGAGWVGLTVAGCLAEMGHQVRCVDIDPARVASLSEGRLPIREPSLDSLFETHLSSGALSVGTDYAHAMADSDFVFVCVGTPPGPRGSADLSALEAAASMISRHHPGPSGPIIILKSTMPPGTAERIRQILPAAAVVSNPEFLREGSAVADFLEAPFIVVGANDDESARAVCDLYEPLGVPIVVCDPATAEFSKYADNAFLAAKISFINEVAELCEAYAVDVTSVAAMIGMDERIRSAYLGAGLGWGGSCFPKDLAAVRSMALERKVPSLLVTATLKVNRRQPALLVRKLKTVLGNLRGTKIAVWGLAFKPECDDVRGSQAIELIRLLKREGARIQAYDPVAVIDETPRSGVDVCADPYAAASGASAIVVATAWKEFQEIDYKRVASLVRRAVIVDGRNCLPDALVDEAGFLVIGVGRRPLPVFRQHGRGEGSGRAAPDLTELRAAAARYPIGAEAL